MFFLLKTQARLAATLAAKVHPLPPGAGEICRRGCCGGARVPAEGLKRCEAVPVPASSRERQRPGAKRCRDHEGVRPVASGGRWCCSSVAQRCRDHAPALLVLFMPEGCPGCPRWCSLLPAVAGVLVLIGAEIMRPRCWCSSCLKGDRVPALVLIGASGGRWAAGAP